MLHYISTDNQPFATCFLNNETTESQRAEQASYRTIAYMVKQPAKDSLRPIHRYPAIDNVQNTHGQTGIL